MNQRIANSTGTTFQVVWASTAGHLKVKKGRSGQDAKSVASIELGMVAVEICQGGRDSVGVDIIVVNVQIQGRGSSLFPGSM